MSSTPSRKREHVDIALHEDVGFRTKTNGFEHWEYEHNALPELNVSEIDTRTDFLGRSLSFPLMITGMTGGYEEATSINRELALACEELRIALGLGSQRQALENGDYHESYATARRHAPHIPIVANIGAVELARWGKDQSPGQRLVDMVQADALAIHCNPLQEFLQPEGAPEFRHVLDSIALLVSRLAVPVVVKEVGAGISAEVAVRLMNVGVQWIDVAGAGGTSWAGVEMLRREGEKPVSRTFWEWGIPTADALVSVKERTGDRLSLIASGGITDGVMIAKSLSLGAELAGSARPLLLALKNHGPSGLYRVLNSWKNDLQGVMFLTGAKDIQHLKMLSLMRIS